MAALERNKNRSLAIASTDELIFGRAPNPVQCGREIVIGAGQVLPEINFTLPQMKVERNTWPQIVEQYGEIIKEVCQRAIDLQVPGLVVEFELLPPMTLNPEWGAEITALLAKSLDNFHKKYGLKSALRVTPVDIRDNDRPPKMRSGELLEKTLQTFELCAKNGADMLSIESTGGKEVHDEALMNADLAGIIFSLGVLAVRDMQFLWQNIVEIAGKTKTVPAGDTACGFANTAMVLADKGMLPKILATVVRATSIVRSLQAYLEGAVGPSKDCAYEGPFLKVLTGVPIAMEGKSSACAHLSAIGNISAAYCDLWSNESVQNIRLLSTFAPVVCLEQLVYDCRLQNVALQEGDESALKLREWLVKSDVYLDPQAYIFKPEAVFEISGKLAQCETALEQAICAADATLTLLRSAQERGELRLNGNELRWLDFLSSQVETIPDDEEQLWAQVKAAMPELKIRPEEYLLA